MNEYLNYEKMEHDTKPVETSNTQESSSHAPAAPVQSAAQKKKNKTILIIVLSILGVILLMGIIGTLVTVFLFKKAVDSVSKNADISIDSNGVQIKDKTTGESVTFGDQKNGTYTFNNKDGSVTTGLKDIPAGFPSSVPLYPGYSLVSSSTAKDNKTNKTSYIIDISSNDSYDKVVSYYTSKLKENGWTLTNSYASSDLTTTFYGEKDTLGLIVTVTKETDKIDISILTGEKSEFTPSDTSTDTPIPDGSGQ